MASAAAGRACVSICTFVLVKQVKQGEKYGVRGCRPSVCVSICTFVLVKQVKQGEKHNTDTPHLQGARFVQGELV
jgi:hypothetical protein